MTEMTLYYSAASPFARKVRVVLAESGLDDRVALHAARGTALDPGTMPLSANPLGKIPVLVRPDGVALHDSRVICRYVASLAEGGRIYPPAPRLWDALTLEALADGMVEAVLAVVNEDRLRPEQMRSAAVVDGQWARVTRSLTHLEDRWVPYLAGPLCIGQVALACALGYIDLRLPTRDWRSQASALARWHEGVSARDSLHATRPDG